MNKSLFFKYKSVQSHKPYFTFSLSLVNKAPLIGTMLFVDICTLKLGIVIHWQFVPFNQWNELSISRRIQLMFMLKYVVVQFEWKIGIGIGITSGLGAPT